MGENWAAFSPSCKGRMLPNLQEKNGQHFFRLLYKNLPPKLQPIEPELRNPSVVVADPAQRPTTLVVL